MPIFAKPSVIHVPEPRPDGPVPGSPLSASSQHAFGGNPELKSCNCGGESAAQGVVKKYGPTNMLESDEQFA